MFTFRSTSRITICGFQDLLFPANVHVRLEPGIGISRGQGRGRELAAISGCAGLLPLPPSL